ncbi:MAG: adenylyl-sulfate kinase [Desulfovibrionaceae bacterium]|jgi:adenylylsulfate kinase|nr:adenylyl-sulfate kinase [Desulfovibrionaceae bacterium]
MSFTLWFTGLSGAGKTTLSSLVYRELCLRGVRVELLDGDAVRRNISNRLTFSREDRNLNVRRLGYIAHLLNRNGVAAVVAAIAPYAESRAANRALLAPYIEAFCNCSLETTEARDPKGLYARARRGEIQHFTGVSDPYETPEAPELDLPTGTESVRACVDRVLEHLAGRGLLPATRVLAPGEFERRESDRAARLAELGYLASGPVAR